LILDVIHINAVLFLSTQYYFQHLLFQIPSLLVFGETYQKKYKCVVYIEFFFEELYILS